MGVRGHPRPAGSGTVILCCLLVAGTAVLPLNAITQLDFFQSYGKGEILRQGDSEFEMVKLDPPMPFFSQTFDHIYVRRSVERGLGSTYTHLVKLWPFSGKSNARSVLIVGKICVPKRSLSDLAKYAFNGMMMVFSC